MTETLTPHQTILIKAHKESAKTRWVDHYLLQVRSVGFTVVNQLNYQKMLPDPNINARKLIVREYRFHPVRGWRFDFALPVYKLGIEIDGGIWQQGKSKKYGGTGHSHPSNIMRDIEKANAATLLGWRMLRFTDKEIRLGESIQMTVQSVGLDWPWPT